MKDILLITIVAALPCVFFYIIGFVIGRQTISKEVGQLLSRPTQRAADVADDRPYCSVCNGYHYPVPKEGHFKPQRG